MCLLKTTRRPKETRRTRKRSALTPPRRVLQVPQAHQMGPTSQRRRERKRKRRRRRRERKRRRRRKTRRRSRRQRAASSCETSCQKLRCSIRARLYSIDVGSDLYHSYIIENLTLHGRFRI